MASFSVDVTKIVFAGGRTGYKDITITGIPEGGVDVSLSDDDSRYFTYINNPESKGTNVYRVSTKSTNTSSSGSDRYGVLKISNKSDSSDYVYVSLKQQNISSGYYITYVISNYSDVYAYGGTNNVDIYFPYSLSDSTTKVELYIDGSMGSIISITVPSWASYVKETTYTDTGFGRVLISCTNNYDGPREGYIKFGNSSGSSKIVGEISQNGYPSSTSGCTQSLSFFKSGGTQTIELKIPSTFGVGNIHYATIGDHIDSLSISKISDTRLNWTVTVGNNNTGNDLELVVEFYGGTNPSIYLGHTIITQSSEDTPTSTLTVDPSVLTYPSSGGGRVMDVTYATSLSTNESSFPDWLGATYVSTGQGSGSYTITAASNTSTSSRSFDFELADVNMSLTVPITQDAGSSASSISVSPSSLSFGPDASYADISLTYGGNHYDTNAAEVYTWVTVNLSDTETGKAAGTVAVASNTSTESRSGNVYFSDELGASIALPIEQAGISFALSANPSTLNIPASGGSVTTAVTYEGTLSAASLPSWLSETHTDTDANHRTYTVTAASNGPTQERTFNWKLNDDYNNMYVFISQAAAEVPSMVISPTSSSVGGSSGTVDITVRSTNISDISYSISDSWITYSSKSGSVYTFSYAENGTADARQGSITFSGGGISKTFKLSQEAGYSISISPSTVTVGSGANAYRESDLYTLSYTVPSGIPILSANIISGDSWLSISTFDDGSGPSYSQITVTANTSTSSRTGVIRRILSDSNWKDVDYADVTIIQQGNNPTPEITVSPSSKRFGSAGGSQVFRVTYNTRINYNTLPSWLSIVSNTSTGSSIEYTMTAAENTDTSSRNFNWVLTDELTTVTVPISQSGASGPGPEPEPVEEGSLKVYPKKLRYYSDGGKILVSFTNRPEAGIGYAITYTDGSGWLSVEGVSPNMYVSATANDGTRRRAEIKFYDLSDNTNYVTVPVIQGSVEGYTSIWMDDLYYPENRDTSGNYFYKVVNQDTEQTYFIGISSKPLSWTGNIGGIDIPRLVDNYIKSDFVQQNTGKDWADMYAGYCTVDVYNMNNTEAVVDATFKYWNDWSRFERKYDYTRSLNDPINGKGCNNMIIPFCVYYDDEATFTIVDTAKNGNINTYTLSSPSSPFAMRYNSYCDIKKLEYKQDNDVLFSYDMNHCGPGAFIYRNRFGGWDSFLIEGNISKTDNYTKQNYRIKGEYNQEYSINTLKYIDEKRTDSIDIDTTYEASTGWLTDEESERLVFHLLSSPIVYFQNLHKENQLYDTDSLDIIPVRITASSSEYKKFRNGRRLVNYLITFEKCNIEKVRQ